MKYLINLVSDWVWAVRTYGLSQAIHFWRER